MGSEKYCFDTSAFIEPWKRYYPKDVFITLWKNLEDQLNNKVIISPYDVYEELKRKDDTLFKWIKKDFFSPHDEALQKEVREILAKYPKLIGMNNNKSMADPYVIGLAKITNTIVVTYEHEKSLQNPKIPDVCKELNIQWCDLVTVMRKMNWTF